MIQPFIGDGLKLWILIKFHFVSFDKFRKFNRIVVKPSAELITGCNIFRPFAEHGALFTDAAWPKSINQNPVAIIDVGRFIYSLRLKNSHFNNYTPKVLKRSDFPICKNA